MFAVVTHSTTQDMAWFSIDNASSTQALRRLLHTVKLSTLVNKYSTLPFLRQSSQSLHIGLIAWVCNLRLEVQQGAHKKVQWVTRKTLDAPHSPCC